MESVEPGAKLRSLGLPASDVQLFYWIAFCLIAFEDLDLSSCDFCTTKVNLTEGNWFWTSILFISNSQELDQLQNSVISSLILISDRTVSINCKVISPANLMSLWSIKPS